MASNFSLRGRILWTAAIVLFVFLGITGFVLDQAFQRSAEQSVEEKLRLQIYGLLSVTEEDEGQLLLPEALQEPRFNHPGSGLFAVVRNANGQELWRSESSITLDLSSQQTHQQYQLLAPGEDRFDRLNDQNLFYLAYKILWLGSGGDSNEYVFVVMESVDGYEAQLSSYRNNLWGWLGLVGVLLIIVQGIVMNWGLKPLGELAIDLQAIESGKQDSLTAVYPDELTGVTKNLNILISSERTQREKYRTTMADLAHSIKTPLAILKNSSSQLGEQSMPNEDVRALIDEQVARMDEIIGYQLERSMTNSSSLIKRAIPAKPVVDRLAAAMRKVYPDTALDVEVDDAIFFGDERDLMEVLGNLVDNACKYGRSSASLKVTKLDASSISVSIEDDGPGIPISERQQVKQRGTRMDSRAPGQGIGLAVVAEIVDRYDGALDIGTSDLGGAKITIVFA